VEDDLRTGLLVTPDDLSPGFVVDAARSISSVAMTSHRPALTHLKLSERVLRWERDAMRDMAARWQDRLGPIARVSDLADWVTENALEQVVTAYPPVGPEAQELDRLAGQTGVRIVRLRRAYDSAAWPHATHGFFRFKEKIPGFVGALKGIKAA